MLIKKKLGASALGLAALMVLAGCVGAEDSPGSGPAESGQPTHITVSVMTNPAIESLMWLVGQQKGFFEEHGVIIDEIVPAEGGGTTMQNIIAGKLPFGTVATSAIVHAYEEGLPIEIIAATTHSPYGASWGVLADSEFETIADLEGATWGYTNSGSVSEAMSYLVPLNAGLDVDTIERSAAGGLGAGLALLEAGEVDVTFITPEVAAGNPSFRVVVDSAEMVSRYALTSIVAARGYAQENPEVAKGLLLGAQKAIAWIETNPEEAAEIYAVATQLDPEAALNEIKKHIENNMWGLGFDRESFEAVATGLQYTDGFESVDWDGLLTDEYLPEDLKGDFPG